MTPKMLFFLLCLFVLLALSNVDAQYGGYGYNGGNSGQGYNGGGYGGRGDGRRGGYGRRDRGREEYEGYRGRGEYEGYENGYGGGQEGYPALYLSFGR